MNKALIRLRPLLGAALLAAAPVWAASQTASSFSSTTQLAGQTLQVNGQGTRYRAIFKVYDLALYLPRKTDDPAQVLSMSGPKRASFVALRDIPSDQFGLSLVSGMRANVSGAHATQLLRYMGEVIELFNTEQVIKAGQTFRVDYEPGKGTSFYLDNVRKGPVVTDPRFIEALLSIWMGPKPVDAQLKDRLLGKAPPAPTATVHSMN